jgi:acyl-CoA dehydrogenase
MRSIGQAELALKLMIDRSLERKTFGTWLADQGVVQQAIARSRCEIEQARLLVLRAAWTIDKLGVKAARHDIAMIKVVIPMQVAVIDRAMQVFGAMGLSPDTPLPELWTMGRALRIADGPDEVHALDRQVGDQAEGAVWRQPPLLPLARSRGRNQPARRFGG